MSASSYMLLRSTGDDRLVGLPLFPSRVFRHGYIFVNARAGIERPQDLVGREVGVHEYQQTAVLWMRALLQHDYDVRPESIRWRYGGVRTPGYQERLHHDVPPGVSLTPIPADQTLEGMLESGALDALMSPAPPLALQRRSPDVRRLFPDYRSVERDYFRRTGYYPIMHMVVVRRDVYEANRWVAVALLEAFSAAKRLGMARLREQGAVAVGVPWLGAALDEVDELFGGDAFPYGLEANRPVLEAMMQYSYEQGLAVQKLDPRELFAPETWDWTEPARG
jgi:4,5-dihydroxyphthalate decarboxylase